MHPLAEEIVGRFNKLPCATALQKRYAQDRLLSWFHAWLKNDIIMASIVRAQISVELDDRHPNVVALLEMIDGMIT